jgi:hypothetical protein
MRLFPTLVGAISVLGLVASSEAQESVPGVVHLDAQHVVVSVFPDSLDGVHVDARLRHKKEWLQYSARFDPGAMLRWVATAKTFARAAASDSSRVSPVVASLEGNRGLSLQQPGKGKGELYWLLHRTDHQEPAIIRADLAFSDTLLTSLERAAHLSAIDSSAFAAGLVAPLAEIPDSLCPWPISVPEAVSQ